MYTYFENYHIRYYLCVITGNISQKPYTQQQIADKVCLKNKKSPCYTQGILCL